MSDTESDASTGSEASSGSYDNYREDQILLPKHVDESGRCQRDAVVSTCPVSLCLFVVEVVLHAEISPLSLLAL